MTDAVQLTIDVPPGGGEIYTFQLLPSLIHKDDQPYIIWNLIKVDPEPICKSVEFIDIKFTPWVSGIEGARERCILVIQIVDKTDRQEDDSTESDYAWHFTLDGIQYVDGQGDFRRVITPFLSRDEKILTLQVENIFGRQSEQVNFSFLALCTNRRTGQSHIFESVDPKIGVGHRPPSVD